MAGIYFHIPFCHSKCSYCDFYKTTNFAFKDRFIHTLSNELLLRKDFLKGDRINTIYFGGGTPSILSAGEIESILCKVFNLFSVEQNVEITLEANPDDLTVSYLKDLSGTPVNRLSIGVQSFFENDLKTMLRRHNSEQAIKCVFDALGSGFENISIDLIYGLPGLGQHDWKVNLNRAFELPVVHLSAYHLTYHKGTRFFELLKKGIIRETDEEESVAQFELLVEMAWKNGFEHYEISNFAKNRNYSQHNIAYWFNKKYLGFGPSAHSYDKSIRCWNIPDIEKYILQIEKGLLFSGSETLSETDKYNDYIITRLRTMWGLNGNDISEKFGYEKSTFFLKQIQPFVEGGFVANTHNLYILTRKGMFISDKIMKELFFI